MRRTSRLAFAAPGEDLRRTIAARRASLGVWWAIAVVGSILVVLPPVPAALASPVLFDGILPVDGDPAAVVAGDFNADGVLDLAVVHGVIGGEPTLSTFLGGAGVGLLQAWSTSPAPYSQIAVGDVDGDGRPDLLALAWSSSQVIVRNGFGDGRFGPPTSVATFSATPS